MAGAIDATPCHYGDGMMMPLKACYAISPLIISLMILIIL
jgi:hypothetical protein